MDALPTVERFLPQAAPPLPVNAAQTPAMRPAERPSFDRCLKTATRNASAGDRKPEQNEQTAGARPADKPARADEKQEPAGDRKNESGKQGDCAVDMLAVAAPKPVVPDPLVNLLAANEQTVAVTDAPDAPDAPAEVEMVQVDVVYVDEPTVPEAAMQTQGEETSKAEFKAQLMPAETAPAATQAAPAEAKAVEQRTNPEMPAEASELAVPVDEHAEQPEPEEMETLVKKEPAQPPSPAAPAPDHASAGREAAVTLNAGQQMRVEAALVQTPTNAGEAAPAARIPAGDAAVMGQVVRGASMFVTQGRTEVRVQLRPPELGSVRLHLVSDSNNMIEARIVTERDDVRQLVERNLPQLREALASSGVEVGHFDVSTQHPGGQSFDNDWAERADGRIAWADAEPEEDTSSASSSGPARGVNRSTAADTIDYII